MADSTTPPADIPNAVNKRMHVTSVDEYADRLIYSIPDLLESHRPALRHALAWLVMDVSMALQKGSLRIIGELAARIEAAPHSPKCDSVLYETSIGALLIRMELKDPESFPRPKCNCWKSGSVIPSFQQDRTVKESLSVAGIPDAALGKQK